MASLFVKKFAASALTVTFALNANAARVAQAETFACSTDNYLYRIAFTLTDLGHVDQSVADQLETSLADFFNASIEKRSRSDLGKSNAIWQETADSAAAKVKAFNEDHSEQLELSIELPTSTKRPYSNCADYATPVTKPTEQRLP
ncbi:hypothetical protein [Caballeronia sp. AZ7_KS35]|uniref:hypothetical protein n=1 Tax=Caballeronia sp. AZ7_KS35 TaxID=2921762 RepID=UPI00202949D0|nr:hypothetical protein [Caballeronia sp. AZ7_KS35]